MDPVLYLTQLAHYGICEVPWTSALEHRAPSKATYIVVRFFIPRGVIVGGETAFGRLTTT